MRNPLLIVLLVLLGQAAAAAAQPASALPPTPAPARGELLYANHCVACHNTEVHWRDKKIARDWPSLQAEVRRWQKFAGLGWSSDDVTAVARYLNARYYRYPAPD